MSHLPCSKHQDEGVGVVAHPAGLGIGAPMFATEQRLHDAEFTMHTVILESEIVSVIICQYSSDHHELESVLSGLAPSLHAGTRHLPVVVLLKGRNNGFSW